MTKRCITQHGATFTTHGALQQKQNALQQNKLILKAVQQISAESFLKAYGRRFGLFATACRQAMVWASCNSGMRGADSFFDRGAAGASGVRDRT
jgi:hypothetical protein